MVTSVLSINILQQIIVIQDLRGQLDDSEILVYEVNNQLEDKEQHIDDLEKELCKFKAMEVCSKVTITQLNKQAKEISFFF